ncbi:Agenet domain plant type domain-containing protein [Dioscorea alata]|uniref:Agenet domain plant type domain-containing protein n=1 Tax=Dioscorea alata TaxID=55571 RepID=A0ACB7UJA1_DIOAL|nr:Agenet domain plant type domain-containing protein [Dioscorea alata]
MMLKEKAHDFVEWREEFVSRERGSRVVQYYLEDSSGGSHLAVVGTERSLRHMFYAIAEEFCHEYGADSCLKWRSKREVVDWLSSFISPRQGSQKNDSLPKTGADITADRVTSPGTCPRKPLDQPGRNLRSHKSDITWTGDSWTCGKLLRHYKAFCRNGTMITTHSFVLVMSEGESRYLAYLDDMYEDKKGQKKVKVRWFHQNQEFACAIPPPTPHPREVFITPYFQVISAECVDDLATVLTPDHFEKCLAALPYDSSSGIHLCFRQYSKNKFKSFDLSSLSGYYDQAVLLCLNICTVSCEDEDEIGHRNPTKNCKPRKIRIVKGNKQFFTGPLGVRVSNRASHIASCKPPYQNMRFGLHAMGSLSTRFRNPLHCLNLPYKVDQKVEMLCQDSGIRGCWFRCTVLRLSEKRLKVQYDDVMDEDGCGNLEEWVPALKAAAPDKLGMRCSGRLTIRPCQPCNSLPDDRPLQIGAPVDAWWNDGWWEGVIIGVESPLDDSIQVYFPGEDVFLTCTRKCLRISMDWMVDQWVDIDAKPDVLTAISSFSPGPKLSPCSTFSKVAESGSSVMSDRDTIPIRANATDEDKKIATSLGNMTDELLGNMNLANPGKRLKLTEDDDGGGEGDVHRGIGD